MKVLINVRRADIASGEPCSKTHCPVAQAVKSLAGFSDVSVSSDVGPIRGIVIANYRRKRYRAFLPQGVSDRISNYDMSGHMRPFSFELTFEPAEL